MKKAVTPATKPRKKLTRKSPADATTAAMNRLPYAETVQRVDAIRSIARYPGHAMGESARAELAYYGIPLEPQP